MFHSQIFKYEFAKHLRIAAGLVTAIFALNSFGAAAGAAAPSASSAGPKKSRGYFISIDGMRPDYLETLVREGKLTAPRGLGWLYRNGFVAKKAWPVSTTLTAVSHVSTITCSLPSDHGIIANNFLSAGNLVSGFAEDIKSETLWQSARAEGRSVLSLAYVGTDGRTPARQVDFGVAYPDAKLIAPSQGFKWKMAELPAAAGWTLSTELNARLPADMREATVTFVLNPITKEEKQLQVLLFQSNADGPTANIEVYFNADKNLAAGALATLKKGAEDGEFGGLYFTETAPDSATRGFKRHVYLTVSDRQPGAVTVFASRPTYNLAQPASFREALDAQNLVWPDDGWRGDKTPLGPVRQVNVYNLHGKFLAEAARVARKLKIAADVTLFYQPVIDSVGHSYQALIPAPFSSANNDPYTQAIVRAFQNVDANVSTVLEDVSSTDVIALMGDHGMDPIKKVVNLAGLIPEQVNKIRVVTSGSLAMVYAQQDSTDADADEIGRVLNTKLVDLKFEEQPVNGRVFRRSDFNTPGKPWQFGEAVWAFTADSGFYYMFNQTSREIFINASALGMHGNDNSVATMATGFLFKAPGIRKSEIDSMNLIDAVPTFTKHMGMRLPAQCRGRALEIKTIRSKLRSTTRSTIQPTKAR